LFGALRLVPWEWYHASRTLRLVSAAEYDLATSNRAGELEPGDDEDTTPEPPSRPIFDSSVLEAQADLRRTELLALTMCVFSPLIGGYLLHCIRHFLSRPSEGLVSSFNITLFVMAAELRPVMTLMELVKQRSLHLQKVVHKEAFSGRSVDVESLDKRVAEMQNTVEVLGISLGDIQGGRDEVVTGVREGVRGEIEALNRFPYSGILANVGAVRRYEKNLALHRAHTEDRINLLSSRLHDLCLVVAESNYHSSGIISFFFAFPVYVLKTLYSVFSLPAAVFSRALRKVVGVQDEKGRGVGKENAKGTKNGAKKLVA
jgi:hypothetical protein